ncbi:hypothetical protein CDAR_127711 [Caerostris darwini]|uniref:Uncharacterized protein n=1 Tax=Caerostris darwini TaxID=1538125 RepID=A0AAV4SSW1_9ARAC|nr:hypothetical protein CDAR_127711 [Caerostris darwini]
MSRQWLFVAGEIFQCYCVLRLLDTKEYSNPPHHPCKQPTEAFGRFARETLPKIDSVFSSIFLLSNALDFLGVAKDWPWWEDLNSGGCTVGKFGIYQGVRIFSLDNYHVYRDGRDLIHYVNSNSLQTCGPGNCQLVDTQGN